MSTKHLNTRRVVLQPPPRQVTELEAIAPFIRTPEELEDLLQHAMKVRREFILSVVRPLLPFRYDGEA